MCTQNHKPVYYMHNQQFIHFLFHQWAFFCNLRAMGFTCIIQKIIFFYIAYFILHKTCSVNIKKLKQLILWTGWYNCYQCDWGWNQKTDRSHRSSKYNHWNIAFISIIFTCVIKCCGVFTCSDEKDLWSLSTSSLI